jgi:hypothetical protein
MEEPKLCIKYLVQALWSKVLQETVKQELYHQHSQPYREDLLVFVNWLRQQVDQFLRFKLASSQAQPRPTIQRLSQDADYSEGTR